ncbi:MAG: hypothetical protein IKL17_02860 [Alistipes sp.]|nr:hypothetical protein [Alistipes sp.]
MKRLSVYSIFATIALLVLAVACQKEPQRDLTTVDSFTKAKPVWAEARQEEKNLILYFREVIKAGWNKDAYIRIAASTDYRLMVNGEFVAHGPCVAAHDFYRIDCYNLNPYLKCGKNLIALEVAGYNEPSYYLLDQPSFLQAEVELNGEIVAATGSEFTAYELNQRKRDVPRFSFQRPFIEHHILTPDYQQWALDVNWQPAEGIQPVKLTEQEAKTLITRRVPYPDYSVHDAVQLPDNKYVFKFKCNNTGFLGMKVKVNEPTVMKIHFDELLDDKGRVRHNSQYEGRMFYELQPGEYTLESFEPYTMQYMETLIESGDCTIERVYMRDYCNSDVSRGKFYSDNADLNRLFEAARETYRQNALDIFMDCPSRERAGWLCDSYFTSRVAFDLSGNTRLEHNFIENFLLPERFKDIDEGMLPMCYPSDHWNHNYIPNWAMWFVLELEEYLFRSGDRATVDQAKKRVYDLVNYFKKYLNEDGLLEKLSKWIFVEWSAANSYVQDVNYPTNMLYAEMLDVVGRLYGDKALAEQAEQVRQTIRQQAFDGEYFIDNAVRDKRGRLQLTGNHTETCQYYAFMFKTATPESHPELWARLRDEFGPARKQNKKYADVPYSNAFIGNYLRLELLSRAGLSKQILEESIAEFLKMADQTGTLWENLTSSASCNHGFASHVIRVLNRDVLGVYCISPQEKLVTLRFADCGLKQCQGSIPVGEESVDVKWTMADGKAQVELSMPEGYTYKLAASDLEVTVVNVGDAK